MTVLDRPFPGSYWVEPAHIAAGEHPGADGRLAAAEGRDALHRRFPIRDRGVPEIETMRAILDTIDEWRAAQRPVYVHCYAGVGRTGMVIGCHLVRRGMAPADALAELGRLRQGTRYAHVPSPETEAQWEFVAKWRRGD